MAAIKMTSLKTSTYSAIETRNSPLVQCKGMASANLSGSLSAYGTQISTNPNIISGTIISTNNGDNLPKAKIRIQKKHASNKPLVNLDENLFARNGNNYVTTKAIIEEAASQRLERNYSYIEAMKEDVPQVYSIPNNNAYNSNKLNTKSNVNKKGDTLPYNCNQINRTNNPNLGSKPPMSIPFTALSPSASSSSSSASSTLSQKHRTYTLESPAKNVNNSSLQKSNNKLNTSNLSKSASQSSILTIFKNTFSPFAIRKWRSKSRDKIIHKTELTSFDVTDNKLKPQIKPRTISPEMSNQQQREHKSIRNSHITLQQQILNTQAPPLPMTDPVVSQDSNKKFHKNQSTSNQIRIKKNNINKRSVDIDINSEMVLNNNHIDVYPNNSIKIETVYSANIEKEAVIAPESPRSFLTNATNRSKNTIDSSMSSSLSSSNSSFALPPSNSITPTTKRDQTQAPVASSLNQINAYFNNLSPKLTSSNNDTPRQKSERIHLTCLLNGYIAKTSDDDLFNSKSTNNISTSPQVINRINNNNTNSTSSSYRNDSNSSYKSNRDSMNKSADILNSERFYDLKKRVLMDNNTTNNLSNLPQQKDQSEKITNKDISNIIDSFEKKILPQNDEEIKPAKGEAESEKLLIEIVNNKKSEVDVIVDTEQSSVKISTEDCEKKMSNSTPQKVNIEEKNEAITHTELIESDLQKDGTYYLKLLDDNTQALNDLCVFFQKYTDQSNPELYVSNEDSLGEIQTAIGKAQLLINQKFKQFRGLCVKNLNEKSSSNELKEGEFVTLDGDLAGFWDMICLQIEDIQGLFKKLEEMKANNWEIIRKPRPAAKKTVNQTKKPLINKSANTQNSKTATTYNSVASKKSDEARKRLIEAKKRAAALKLQNQNNDIEIFE